MKKHLRLIAIFFIILILSYNILNSPIKLFKRAKNTNKTIDYIHTLENKDEGKSIDRMNDQWKLLISSSKNIIRTNYKLDLVSLKDFYKIIDIRSIIYNNIRNCKVFYVEDFKIVNKDWNGKDRIISLDLEEENILTS